MMRKLFPAICMMFGIAAVLGCGGGDDFTLASVSGKVTLDGEPVNGVKIVFMPKATESNPAPGPFSTAMTDSLGAFTLKCRNGKDGAVVGNHTVTFEVKEGGVSEEAIGEAQSELQEAQAEGDAGTVAKAKKQLETLMKRMKSQNGGLPDKYVNSRDLTFNVPEDGTDAANIELTSD